jgi:hypothetical protein
MNEKQIENQDKRQIISSAELDRLFLDVLPQANLPDYANRDDVKLSLTQKVARHERAAMRKREKQREVEEALKLEEERHCSLAARYEPKTAPDHVTNDGDETPIDDKHPIVDPACSIYLDTGRDADRALADLRDFAKGAESLTILDPYLFQFRETEFYRSEEDYVEKMCSIIPNSARRLTLVSTGFSTSVKRAFMRRLRDGRPVHWISQNRFHDRVLVRDDNRGLLFGTSGGGFGSKGFLVLDVPERDILELKAFLFDLDRD